MNSQDDIRNQHEESVEAEMIFVDVSGHVHCDQQVEDSNQVEDNESHRHSYSGRCRLFTVDENTNNNVEDVTPETELFALLALA